MQHQQLSFNSTLLATWTYPYFLYSVKEVEAIVQSKMDQTPHRRASVFSYHDTNLMALVLGLGHSVKEWPAFASALLFEVWH